MDPKHRVIKGLHFNIINFFFYYLNIIRIYQECEGRKEKSVLRIAVCHYEACRVMTNGDPEGQIFLSYPHTNNEFFFLLTTVFLFKNKLPEVPE